MIVCRAKTEDYLIKEYTKIRHQYIWGDEEPAINEYFLFREPDLNNEATALAVYFYDSHDTRIVNRWQLWK